MRVVRDLAALPAALRGSVLAIGNFDGLHLGHRAVVEAMLAEARAAGAVPAVMTFEPHPRRFFTPGHPPHRIEPLHRKLRRLRLAGVEAAFLLRFNEALSRMDADRFVSEVLQDALGVAQVITGEGFVFGHRRSGNSETLHAAAVAGRFGYRSVPHVLREGEMCSSSAIRSRLALGDMARAAAMLGRPYEITGRVRHGAARGRTLGAPTANIGLHELFLPRYGVYAVRYRIAEGPMLEAGREWKPGVANLGVRPSFGGTEPSLEVHGLEESGSLYGKRLRVRMEAFLREEKKFDDIEALRRQIQRDIVHAREVLT